MGNSDLNIQMPFMSFHSLKMNFLSLVLLAASVGSTFGDDPVQVTCPSELSKIATKDLEDSKSLTAFLRSCYADMAEILNNKAASALFGSAAKPTGSSGTIPLECSLLPAEGSKRAVFGGTARLEAEMDATTGRVKDLIVTTDIDCAGSTIGDLLQRGVYPSQSFVDRVLQSSPLKKAHESKRQVDSIEVSFGPLGYPSTGDIGHGFVVAVFLVHLKNGNFSEDSVILGAVASGYSVPGWEAVKTVSGPSPAEELLDIDYPSGLEDAPELLKL